MLKYLLRSGRPRLSPWPGERHLERPRPRILLPTGPRIAARCRTQAASSTTTTTTIGGKGGDN
eukprot:11550084-Prorocentrum_lima.AAC.1